MAASTWRERGRQGTAPIDLVPEELCIVISDPHEATIGGHVLELLGRLRVLGEMLDVDGHRAEVAAVGDARIMELRCGGAPSPPRRETEPPSLPRPNILLRWIA